MDSLKSALENIAADKGRICGSLYYIRSHVTNKLEGINELQDCGGIKILVKCLKQLNPKILSLTLSILGNCSMTEGCRDQLFKYGVIKDLSIILKNLNVDAIVNRSCRMIANLAESQACIDVMYKNNLLSIIVHVLSTTKCDQTKYSAIRALRKIWEKSSKTGCALMLKHQAVEVVSGLLKSKCKEIVVAVLRAQASFLSNPINSKHRTNNTLIVLQILGKTPPESVITIKTLMDLLPKEPIVAKIIFSICKKLPYAIENIFQSKLILYIIDFLKNQKNDYLIRSLFLLLDCPLSRNRFIETEHGISIILNIISGTNITHKELAINALLKFQHSKNSLTIMKKQGLMPILINNLSSYLEKNKVSTLCQSKIEHKSSDTTSLFVSCASPSSSSGMSSCSPVRVSWTPPKEDDNITSYCLSPNYSPVCESFDSESINGDDSKSDVSDFDLVIMEDDEMQSPEKPTLDVGMINMLQLLLYLLYADDFIYTMALKDIWEKMLDCILYIKNGSIITLAVKILDVIPRNNRHFESIVTDGLILSTHQKMCRPIHDLELCQCCNGRNEIGMEIIKNTTYTFETTYSDSVLVSIMNDTSETNQRLKKLVAVTIAIVIKWNLTLLGKSSRYKVFEYLCIIIEDSQNELFDDAIGALMALFKVANITLYKPVSKLCQTRNCHKKIVKKETTVTLALDDGTSINANKSYLSLKSPMFEAMFRCGGFKESYQSTIRLNDVSSECLKSFMNLLDEYCDCLLPRDISVLLELIMITDKYMLNELPEKIGKVVLNTMSLDNAWHIYDWTKVTGYQLELRSDTGSDVVKYLFSSNSRFPDRLDIIKKICKSVHSKHFNEDLKNVLKKGLIMLIDDKVSIFYIEKYLATY